MASPAPAPATRLRPSQAASSASSSSSFPTSICGFLSLGAASRVSSVSFRRRPASPLVRCSQDPGKIEVFNTERTEQSQGGSTGSINHGKYSTRSFSSKELLERLKRYGAAGVLSYGLLNTAYYCTALLLVWFYFSPAPGKMGYAAAVERFLKLMAMVWAGSQVTKILRAGGALALAPFVDRGLRWFTVRFNCKSEGKAFATIVGFCFALAALLFFGLTILSA
uniref:E2F-related protein n=1 Tax=Oryza australiensis TaxID=4532 RepID=A0A8K1DH49_9ORYZ|nr:E2F-related protein [Oryza australiensis]